MPKISEIMADADITGSERFVLATPPGSAAPINTTLSLDQINARANPYARPAYSRSTDYQLHTPMTAAGRPIAILILQNGQSLAIGNAATKALSTVSRYPDNLLMPELTDAAGVAFTRQSPWVASNPISGRFIPAVETVNRVNPDFLDPVTGEMTTMPANQGETGLCALGNNILDAFTAAGLALPIIVVASVGKGGERISHLARGNYMHNRKLEIIRAFKAWCDANFYGCQIHTRWIHGEANSTMDESGSLSLQITAEQYAAEIVQLAYQDREDIRRETGLPLSPKFFISQCDFTYPTAQADNTPLNGKPVTASQAAMIADDADPDIHLLQPNYFAPRQDEVHPQSEGYFNMGLLDSVPIMQTLFGVGNYRIPRCVGHRWIRPNTLRLIYDKSGGPLRLMGYTAYDFTITDGGIGNHRGDLFAGLTFDYAKPLFRVDTVDGSGVITAMTMLDPGSSSTDPTGSHGTIAVLSNLLLHSAGTGYPNNVQVTLAGGDYRRPARLRVISGTDYIPTGVEVLDPGDYDTLPTAPMSVVGGGPLSTGLTLDFATAGTPPTIAVRSIKQLGLTDTVPLLDSTTIVLGDIGVVDRKLTGPASDVTGGYPSEVTVASIDGGGNITSVHLTRNGQYFTVPANPVTFTDGAGTTITVNVPRGAFPIMSPGPGLGFNVTDDSYPGDGQASGGLSYPLVTSVAIATEWGITDNAVDLTLDQAAGPNTVAHIGQYAQYLEGGGNGGRVCLATAPLIDATFGYFAQPQQDFALRQTVKVPSPWQVVGTQPPLAVNGLLEIATAGDSVTITSAGAQAADGWRGWRNGSGAHVVRRAGARQKYSIGVQRDVGTSGTSAISMTLTLTGEEAKALWGKPVTAAFAIRCGADFSPAGGVSVRVYTDATVEDFGTSSVPTGAVELGTQLGVHPTTTVMDAAYSPGVDNVVPTDTAMVIFWIQMLPVGTAGADDWFAIEEFRIDPGTVLRPFISLPLVVEQDRLILGSWGVGASGGSPIPFIARNFYADPRPQDFGGTDFAAAQKCARYAMDNVGRMLLDTAYALNDDLVLDKPLHILGSAGSSLDFSTRTGYANGSTDSLIKFLGSAGSKVALSVSAAPASTVLKRATAGTRSGTSIIFTSDFPHGLGVGDPVYAFGGSGSTPSGQRVFFTQNLDGSSATRTVPFIVSAVGSSTTFTVTCDNTGDMTLTETVYLRRAADVLLVPSTTGFVAEQRVLVVSEAVASDGASENIRIGEYQTIKQVVPSMNMLILHSEVRDSYLTSDTAGVIPMSMLLNPKCEGFKLLSKGSNPDPGYGDRGILYKYCENPETDLVIRNVDQMGVNVWSCIGGYTTIDTIFDGSNEAGLVTALDIQYGAAVSMATEGHEHRDCHVEGGRHALVQSGTGVSGNYGKVRGWKVRGGLLKGQWLGSISGHQSVVECDISGVTIQGAQTGINPRAGKWTIANSSIHGTVYGIQAYNEIGEISVTNCRITGELYGMFVYHPLSAGQVTGPIKLKGCTLVGGEMAFRIELDTAGVNLQVEIDDNYCFGQKSYSYITVGTGSGDGFTGSVARNTFAGYSGSSVTYALRLDNGQTVDATRNILLGATAWTRAIYVYGGTNVHTVGTIAPNALATSTYANGAVEPVPTPKAATLVTIASDAITPATAYEFQTIVVDTEGGAASDDLKKINVPAGTSRGATFRISIASASRTVTVKHLASGGNFQLRGAADLTLSATWNVIDLVWNGVSLLAQPL